MVEPLPGEMFEIQYLLQRIFVRVAFCACGHVRNRRWSAAEASACSFQLRAHQTDSTTQGRPKRRDRERAVRGHLLGILYGI